MGLLTFMLGLPSSVPEEPGIVEKLEGECAALKGLRIRDSGLSLGCSPVVCLMYAHLTRCGNVRI